MIEWRKEFSWFSFGLQHGAAEDFSSSTWQKDRSKVSVWYLTYRMVVALICFGIVVSNATVSQTGRYWIIFLTHHGLLLLAAHMLVSVAVLVEKLFYERNGTGGAGMSVIVKISWVLSNIVNVVAVVVTVVYWTALYKPEDGLTAMDFFIHGFNSLICIIDIFVVARPCRIQHFYQPLVFLICYVIFTALYWAFGGVNHRGETFVYPILRWEDTATTVPLVIGASFAVIILHCLLCLLYYLRDYVHCVLFPPKTMDIWLDFFTVQQD